LARLLLITILDASYSTPSLSITVNVFLMYMIHFSFLVTHLKSLINKMYWIQICGVFMLFLLIVPLLRNLLTPDL